MPRALQRKATEAIAKDFANYITSNKAIQANTIFKESRGTTGTRVQNRTARRLGRGSNRTNRYDATLAYLGHEGSGTPTMAPFGTTGLQGLMPTYNPSGLQRALNFKDPSVTMTKLRVCIPVSYQVYQSAYATTALTDVVFESKNTSTMTMGFLPAPVAGSPVNMSNTSDQFRGGFQIPSGDQLITLSSSSLSNGWGGGPFSQMYDQWLPIAVNWHYIPLIPFNINGAIAVWMDSDPLDVIRENVDPVDKSYIASASSTLTKTVLPPPQTISDVYANDSVYVGPLNLPAQGSIPGRLFHRSNEWMMTQSSMLALSQTKGVSGYGAYLGSDTLLGFMSSWLMNNACGKLVVMAESFNDPNGQIHTTRSVKYGNLFVDVDIAFRNRSMYGGIPMTPPGVTIPDVPVPFLPTADLPVAPLVAVTRVETPVQVTGTNAVSSQSNIPIQVSGICTTAGATPILQPVVTGNLTHTFSGIETSSGQTILYSHAPDDTVVEMQCVSDSAGKGYLAVAPVGFHEDGYVTITAGVSGDQRGLNTSEIST